MLEGFLPAHYKQIVHALHLKSYAPVIVIVYYSEYNSSGSSKVVVLVVVVLIVVVTAVENENNLIFILLINQYYYSKNIPYLSLPASTIRQHLDQPDQLSIIIIETTASRCKHI